MSQIAFPGGERGMDRLTADEAMDFYREVQAAELTLASTLASVEREYRESIRYAKDQRTRGIDRANEAHRESISEAERNRFYAVITAMYRDKMHRNYLD